mgnify:CR=1 FL=1|tara:strand:- start:272741 stop:273790 length:1050 start_codon:yes stop_codon:yes gene_type:complete
MFWLSLAFLVCLAILIVLWVDVPNLRESANAFAKSRAPGGTHATTSDMGVVASHDFFSLSSPAKQIEFLAIIVMLAIWPIVIVESIVHWITRPYNRDTMKTHGFGILFCLCPALRMCARSPEMHDRLWLPGLGWRRADSRLRRRLQRQFSVPMIMIALLIMPVLIVEFFLKEQVAEHLWLRVLLHIGTGVIWFAFAAEFILMVSVADRKLEYCKKHWLDLAIILLPLISFLRSLQTMRATRLAKLMKIQQLSQIARVYRLRATAMKMMRALVVIEFFRRALKLSPERSIAKLKRQLADVESEAKQLRRKIARLERDRRSIESARAKVSSTDPVAPEQLVTASEGKASGL